MIEIAFSALARQCLERRIPTRERLESERLTLVSERAEKQIKLHWQFSIDAARTRLNTHYRRVLVENSKYKET